MIVLYSVSCEGCSGNQALRKIKGECSSHGVEFQERRTILWKVYEKEAKAISEALGVKMPFFYNTETEKALEGNSFTPLEDIRKFIEGEETSKN